MLQMVYPKMMTKLVFAKEDVQTLRKAKGAETLRNKRQKGEEKAKAKMLTPDKNLEVNAMPLQAKLKEKGKTAT